MAYNKDTDYTALMQAAVEKGDYHSAALYEQARNEKVTDMINSGNNPNGYVTTNRYSQYLGSSGDAGKADYGKYAYDPKEDAAYMSAMQALQQAQSNKPVYEGTYDQALADAYDRILNREPFRYDMGSDAMYQQYKDSYTNLGQLAMMDTMGQAAALTGGYGSSYGQSVGQQQYNAYLQQLNDMVPSLYGMALDRYNAQGSALEQQAAIAGQLQQQEYNRYLDAMGEHWNQVGYLQGIADTAYDRGYRNHYNAMQLQQQEADRNYQMALDAYNRQQAADDKAYDREMDAYGVRQDSYDRLAEMIVTMGYVPTEDELKAAGMSAQQYEAWKGYFDKLNPVEAPAAGGYGGGSGDDETKADYAAVSADAEKLFKIGATGEDIVGYLSEALLSGQITVEQANELEKKYTSGAI